MRGHVLTPLLRHPETRWQLVHAASGRVLASDIRTAFDSATRREGLLRQAEWPAGSAMVIAPCQAIHTVGMGFPIDVVFIDRAGVIVKARERVVPWRVVVGWRGFAAVELPWGTVSGTVGRGDTLTLVAPEAGLTSLGHSVDESEQAHQ